MKLGRIKKLHEIILVAKNDIIIFFQIPIKFDYNEFYFIVNSCYQIHIFEFISIIDQKKAKIKF